MTKPMTTTLAICLAGAAAAGIGLARPAAEDAPPLPEGGYSTDAGSEYGTDEQGTDDYGTDGYGTDDYGASTGDETGAAVEGGIVIVNFDFEGTLTVKPGDTVVVTNEDSAPHSVTSNDGLFDSGVLSQGESTTIVVPNDPGEYAFFCTVHPSMTGTLVIESS